MTREHGPERPGGQGLDPNQYESGDKTIAVLLSEQPAADQVDLVTTWRDGAYEVWARRGMIRFKRFIDERGNLSFEIVEQIGENPVANQDPYAVATIADEIAASRAGGFAGYDPNRAFIEPHALSYPHAYERIAQLFDSPRAPDLMVSPKCYAYGIQAGQHGALDVVQSRAPLAFAGPRIKPGRYASAPRHVDIAPTIAHLAGLPALGGSEVYLRRQDGRVLHEITTDGGAPARVYLILFDGLSHTELGYHLEHRADDIPNLAGLIARAAFFTHGSTVNFPSITWPSHSTILTGAWCGHHDIVNPTFYVRETRKVIPIQGDIFEGEGHVAQGVETLYEAFKRAFGDGAITASIHEPQSRGADHATFERRIVGDKQRLRELTAELIKDVSPRWNDEGHPDLHREEVVDARGIAQMHNLFNHCGDQPPVFVAHEFVLTDGVGHEYGPHHEVTREALRRTDARLGQVLRTLEERGLLDTTLFVFTADHGMASQRVELNANPAVEPQRHGLRGVFAEPMIYLRDMAVECARTPDHRSLRVTVRDNDADEAGVRPFIEGAELILRGAGGAEIARTLTGARGSAAMATPANVENASLTVRIAHPEFNPRTLTADNRPVLADLLGLLYR